MIRVEGASRSLAPAPDGARRVLLHPTHLEIEPGSAHLLLGANGSGKTTLIRILAGIAAPTEGRVVLDGDVVASPGRAGGAAAPLWPRVASLFEEPDPQFLSDSVEGEIQFGLESLGLSGDAIRDRTGAAIEEYGLTALAARDPRTLSAGEKARTLLAAAMAARPATLLLDQTLAHLDPGSRRALEAGLAERVRAGTLAVFRTHQDSEPPYAGERLHLIASGRLQASDEVTARDVADRDAIPFPLALRVSAWLAERRAWSGPLAWDAAALVAGLAAGARAARGGDARDEGAGDRDRIPPAPGAAPNARDAVLALSGVGVTPHGRGGGRPVLEGFDLTLRAGEIVAMIGASGSGKTTALHVAAGLRDATRGEAERRNGSAGGAAHAAPGASAGVALALEYPERQLFGRTVSEDVAVGLWIAGVAAEERVRRAAAALRLVGLDPEAFAGRSPSTLSEGEKRRAALAAFLIDPPRAFLLDEPTAGLDPEGRRSLRAALRALRAAGCAILFASHDLDFVSSVADRVLVLGREPAAPGRVLGTGAPDAIWRDAALLARAGLPPPDHVAIEEALVRAGFLDSAPGLGADALMERLERATPSLTTTPRNE